MCSEKEKISTYIRASAEKLGFDAVGFAPAAYLEEESLRFKDWLKNGYHATMGYMSRNVEKRLNPKELNHWARSVVVCLYNYYPAETEFSSACKISKYAYGLDYHSIIKDKLKQLAGLIEKESGKLHARVFVDTAPVMERAWAKRAGLGWTGKNACLINKKKGSFFFIGTIILDLELVYDTPSDTDHCGTCTRCMDACPNKAIIAPGVIDANKCISYLTIEHKGDFPEGNENKLHNWIFGCDICQDVCPWNRFSKPHNEPAFNPKPELLGLTDEDWKSMDKITFIELFKNTAVERTGYDALRRNLLNNEQGSRDLRSDIRDH